MNKLTEIAISNKSAINTALRIAPLPPEKFLNFG